MAEAVFRHMVARAGLAHAVEADSAGTGPWHAGEQPHHGTRRVLRERGIDYSHRARAVAPDDLKRFDYLIALDSDNLADLRALARGNHTRVSRLLDYAPAAGVRDVPAVLHALATYVLTAAGAPTSLRALGLREADLDRVAETAAASPYPNPRPVRADELRAVLARAY